MKQINKNLNIQSIFLGWKGKNCTEKNCLLKPCVNEGVCTAIYENVTNQIEYKCICPVSVYGEQCQLKGNVYEEHMKNGLK